MSNDKDQSKYLLEFKDIGKSFHGVHALQNVNLSVKRGEVHALCGENGAGKSTLMKLLAGIYQPTTGSIFFEGEKVKIPSAVDAQHMGISTIFQEFSLLPNFTVFENVFLSHKLDKAYGFLDKAKERKRTQKILDAYQITLDINKRVEDLSIVQQQMVEIVKAISTTAKVVIMDEPTATLTDLEVQKLFQIIESLKKEETSMLYISHRLEEVFAIADTVSVLKDGQMVGTRPIKDTTKNDLIKMMVGREVGNLYPEFGARETKPILEVKNLHLKGKLEDISFTVQKGEIVGISGIVGAGRTTLVKCLMGIIKITAGEVLLYGEPIKIKDINTAMELEMAYISEDRKTEGILGFLPVRNNLTSACLEQLSKWGIINRKKETLVVAEYIEKLTIKCRGPNQTIETLSGGNQQKVLISRWLVRNPELIIFDEPTRGIDVGAKAEIYKMMRDLANEGMAIIMISSELPEVIGMSDRILVVRDGKIVASVDQHERVRSEEEIISLAVGHEYTLHAESEKAAS